MDKERKLSLENFYLVAIIVCVLTVFLLGFMLVKTIDEQQEFCEEKGGDFSFNSFNCLRGEEGEYVSYEIEKINNKYVLTRE